MTDDSVPGVKLPGLRTFQGDMSKNTKTTVSDDVVFTVPKREGAARPEKNDGYGDKKSLFDVGRAFNDEKIQEGTIVTDKKKKHRSFTDLAKAAAAEWWSTTSSQVQRSSEKFEILKPKEVTKVSSPESRAQTVKDAASYTKQAPRDDFNKVVGKLRTFQGDAARAADKAYTVKDASDKAAPSWSKESPIKIEPAPKVVPPPAIPTVPEKTFTSTPVVSPLKPESVTPPRMEKSHPPIVSKPQGDPDTLSIAPTLPKNVRTEPRTFVTKVPTPSHPLERKTIESLAPSVAPSVTPSTEKHEAVHIRPDTSLRGTKPGKTTPSWTHTTDDTPTPPVTQKETVVNTPIEKNTPSASPALLDLRKAIEAQRTPHVPTNLDRTTAEKSSAPVPQKESEVVASQSEKDTDLGITFLANVTTPTPPIQKPIEAERPVSLPQKKEGMDTQSLPKETPAILSPAVSSVYEEHSKPLITPTQEDTVLLTDDTSSAIPEMPQTKEESLRTPQTILDTQSKTVQEETTFISPESSFVAPSEKEEVSNETTSWNTTPLPTETRSEIFVDPYESLEKEREMERQQREPIPTSPVSTPPPTPSVPSYTPPPTNIQRERSASPLFKITLIIIVILITGGLGIVTALYTAPLFTTPEETPLEGESDVLVSIPAYITPQSVEAILLGGSSVALRETLAERLLAGGSGVLQYYPVASLETSLPATTQDIFSVLAPSVSSSFVRALDPVMMLGSDDVGGQREPFIILNAHNFDAAFAGMLTWEKTLTSDLSPFFDTTVAVENVGTGLFIDALRSNRSIRILKDTSGSERMVYAFINKKLIIITTSTEALSSIISKLK